MALARVITESPHAVQRELLIHRFRWGDFGAENGTPLELWEFVSFVLGAPPTSGVGLAMRGGWSPTDHLLANLAEQQANLITLGSRYARPGVDATEPQTTTPQTTPQTAPTGYGAPEPPAPAEKLSAERVQSAVAMGGKFDRFDTPEEFEAMRLKAAQTIPIARRPSHDVADAGIGGSEGGETTK